MILNEVAFVVIHGVPSSQEFLIDPRKKGTISCKGVEISQYQ